MAHYSSVAELFNLPETDERLIGATFGPTANSLADSNGNGSGDVRMEDLLKSRGGLFSSDAGSALDSRGKIGAGNSRGGGTPGSNLLPGTVSQRTNMPTPSNPTPNQLSLNPSLAQLATFGNGLALLGTGIGNAVANLPNGSSSVKRNAAEDINGNSKRAKRNEAEDMIGDNVSLTSGAPDGLNRLAEMDSVWSSQTSSKGRGSMAEDRQSSLLRNSRMAENRTQKPRVSSGKATPSASFYADFLDASRPPEAPPSPNTKPKRFVALSKKALQVYRFREEANASALQRQTVANIALIDKKKNEAAMVEEANSIRAAVVQEAKANMSGAHRRGQPHLPRRSGAGFEIILPTQRKPWRKLSKDLFAFSEDQMKDVAEREEFLVPIRIDAEANGYRVKDTFTWNMNDPLVNPVAFAEILCEDLRIPENAGLVSIIVHQIIEQVEDHRAHAPVGLMERAQLAQGREEDEPAENESTSPSEQWIDNAGELRIPVQLNIVVNQTHLHDQIEWDILSWRNNPEAFAEVLTREENLDPEFKTAIAHQIREQVQHFVKSLMQVGHAFDGSPVEDEDIAESILPAIQSAPRAVIRDSRGQSFFGPVALELKPDELERLDKESSKDAKKRKRGGRARRTTTSANTQERETPLTMRSAPLAISHASAATAHAAASNAQHAAAASASADASGGNRRNRRAAAVAAASATAAMLAADRALDRAEREGRDFEDDDDEDSQGRLGQNRPLARGSPGHIPYQAVRGAPLGPGPAYPRMEPRMDYGGGRPYDGPDVHHHYTEQVNEWDLPQWLQLALARLRSMHPLDIFSIAKRARTPQDPPDAGHEAFLRIRCQDCPGRQYALGPERSLGNFEVHLQNRNHRQAVQHRVASSR